ncbi:ATP-binding protein [Bacillus sp. 31A1R]|uniref:histidine kinase n=1 Tax=Robertmurraya mangrovi TaxID=3098077 RepID=A0ABU5ITR6_9BACI|nr:ATP-binding protein [Bacillus sp. 31A1R]MDZ5470555.1 ATP-binding protein [Bacillus sp. 31A1R]
MDKMYLIQNRNRLLMVLLWVFYLIDSVFYYIVDESTEMLWPPYGLLICLICTALYKMRINAYVVMVSYNFLYFGYIFYLNITYPYLSNYAFFLLGIIAFAFYQSYLSLFLALTLAVFSLIYFSITNGELIFQQSGAEELPYFVLLALLIGISLFFMIKYANQLWEKAYANEKKAKIDLQSTKSLVEAFFQNTKDSIAVMDLNLKVIEVNDAFIELFNVKTFKPGIHITSYIRDHNNPLMDYLENAKKGFGKSGADIPIYLNEKNYILDATISPVYNGDKQVFAVSLIARDSTEKRLMEEYIRNSEKLKISGEIAAGVAHEIRNPLTVISGFIKMISEKDSAFSQYFSIINSEIHRMNLIISEFLILSKPHVLNPKAHSITEVINEVILLFESEANFKGVSIIKNCKATHDVVLCEANQMKQVFINLLKNAFEAMPTGGTIQFDCINLNKNEVLIVIKDNGIGIPSEVLKKIGTPFFTTKENGTGLGLMITERIIEQHKGSVKISSNHPRGTCVEITLPVYSD